MEHFNLFFGLIMLRRLLFWGNCNLFCGCSYLRGSSLDVTRPKKNKAYESVVSDLSNWSS